MKDWFKVNSIMIPGYIKWVRVITALLCYVSLLLCKLDMAVIAILISTVLFCVIECIGEYATYAGINSTKTIGKNFIRATSKGEWLYRNALKGDTLETACRVFLVMGIVTGVGMFTIEGIEVWSALLGTAAITVLTWLLINIMRVITRHLNLTRQVFYTVAGVIGYVFSAIVGVFVEFHFDESTCKKMTVVDICVLTVGLLLNIWLSKRSISGGVRGFLGGFADAKVSNKEEEI